MIGMNADMNSFCCKLSPHVEFSTPKDYVKNCNGGGVVSLLSEATQQGMLLVRWNKERIEFLANNKGASYVLSGVRKLTVELTNVMVWKLWRLDAQLAHGGTLVLAAEERYKHEFDEVIDYFQRADLPLPIEVVMPQNRS